MIKINLLPQQKRKGGKKRSSAPVAGMMGVYAGLASLAGLGVLVWALVHRPLQSKLKTMTANYAEQKRNNDAKEKSIADYKVLKATVDAAQERMAAIGVLLSMRSVPAHLIHELGEILTPGRLPTMSAAMAEKTSDGPKGDPNKRFLLDWDPKHVWITKFTEKDGEFTLLGGAQSDSDVGQLTKRMSASVFFTEVSPKGGQRAAGRDGGISYYEFTITGKVVY